jgi:hypothetical protein
MLKSIPDADGKHDYQQKRQELTDAVNHGGVAGKQILFSFQFFRRRKRRQVGIAEPALNGYGLDGFAADRTGFFIFVHGGSVRSGNDNAK